MAGPIARRTMVWPLPAQAQDAERTPQQFLLDVILDAMWLLQRSGLLSPGFLNSISMRLRCTTAQACVLSILTLNRASISGKGGALSKEAGPGSVGVA